MRGLIVSAAIVAAVSVAQASLIAADSWVGGGAPNYVVNSNLNGQNPTVTPGWTGAGSTAWSSGTANLQADAVGLDYTPLTSLALGYPAGGKGKYIASSTNAFRAANRRMDNYTPENTYYMSFLVNPGGSFLATGGRDGYALTGFTNFINGANAFNNVAGAGEVFGLMAGFKGNGDGTANLIIRHRGLSEDNEDVALLANVANETYYVVARLDVNASGIQEAVTFWVNPTNLTSEANATATAAATGTFASLSMDLNNRIDRTSLVTTNWARSYFWDENRLGTDFFSVVPEPSTMALLALGGLALLRRR